ncbi:UDP-N-acetylmuramoyl-tripeptide--D-alanyl-D-alanine ligase, partial [Thermodesulfobacteriota bacterium]
MPAEWGDIQPVEIQGAVNGPLAFGDSNLRVKGLSADSRTVKEGELFWALKGEKYDGHDFIVKALELGAVGAVLGKQEWDLRPEIEEVFKGRFKSKIALLVKDTTTALGDFAGWWREKHNTEVIAVTGSAGKTTTKEITAAILSRKWEILKTKGNFNNLIGLPLTILSMKTGHEKAVLEMGMNKAGEIKRLTEIANPDLGLITNVGMAHLEGLGDLSGVARAKAEMAEQMSPKALIVINGDDSILRETVSEFRKDLVTFGLRNDSDFYACDIRDFGLDGVKFDIVHKKGKFSVKINTPGSHSVINALAAAAVGLCLDVSEEDVVSGLESFSGIDGRFNIIKMPGNRVVIDDTYNSNP